MTDDATFAGEPPLIRRYGPVNVAETVENALKAKLPKVIATSAVVRVLMLERNQWTLSELDIYDEIDKRRTAIPGLAQVEVWIVETVTASADCSHGYVDFKRYAKGTLAESIAFNTGKLFSRSKDGMPIPIPDVS